MSLTASKPIFLTLNLLFVLLSFGQKNMQPGYIVTAQDDTIKGFIDNRVWKKNPGKIYFSHTVEAVTKSYSPAELKSFGVANDIYVSAIVITDASPYRATSQAPVFNDTKAYDTVFLQSLIRGDKSLYYYMDINNMEHYFIGNGSGFDLLGYKRYEKKDSLDHVYVAEDKRYLGQLNFYLQDCKTILGQLKDLRYEQSELTDLFQYYYTCTGKTIKFQNKVEKKTNQFGIIAGLSLTNFEFIDGPTYLKESVYSTSANFSGGMFFDLMFRRKAGRLSLYNELQYYSFIADAVYEQNYQTITTKIGFNYLQMNNMIRFRFPLKNAYPFFNAGFSTGFGFSETNYVHHSNSTNEGVAVEELNKLNLGIPMGMGIKIKKYSFEIRYLAGIKKQNVFYTNVQPYSKSNSIFFLFGYQF
jgi:hypothetical protein